MYFKSALSFKHPTIHLNISDNFAYNDQKSKIEFIKLITFYYKYYVTPMNQLL
jgi:hypothetical protein